MSLSTSRPAPRPWIDLSLFAMFAVHRWAISFLVFVAPVDGYKIIHVLPHDPSAFTQGLVHVDGHLYEITGLNGHSSIRMVGRKV